MASETTRETGIYYNSSPSPVFMDGKLVGGHEYVFIDGYVRIPGHLVRMEDPRDDDNAPESLRRAFAAMERLRGTQEVHANSSKASAHIVALEDGDEPEGQPAAEERPKPKPRASTKKTTRKPRTGERESTDGDSTDQ